MVGIISNNMEANSSELTEFNLQESISLGECGLIRIIRGEDGKLVLVEDGKYGIIDANKPTLGSFLDRYSTLGFVLDIGIRREKLLTHGSGFYFGQSLLHPQSRRPISQGDFDKKLLFKISSLMDSLFQSGDKEKEVAAIKTQNLLNIYNNARLLFPNFLDESYLGLMRIIEALSFLKYAGGFATFSAMISPETNKEIYGKVSGVASYKERLKTAAELFAECLGKATKEKWGCLKEMSGFADADKFIFACFYSAYQYRNKLMHNGFPFPDTVKETWDEKTDSGVNYLHPSWGTNWIKIYRPGGLEEGDSIDMHEVLESSKNFKEKYYLIIPTWYFLKRLVRTALLNEVDRLGALK